MAVFPEFKLITRSNQRTLTSQICYVGYDVAIVLPNSQSWLATCHVKFTDTGFAHSYKAEQVQCLRSVTRRHTAVFALGLCSWGRQTCVHSWTELVCFVLILYVSWYSVCFVFNRFLKCRVSHRCTKWLHNLAEFKHTWLRPQCAVCSVVNFDSLLGLSIHSANNHSWSSCMDPSASQMWNSPWNFLSRLLEPKCLHVGYHCGSYVLWTWMLIKPWCLHFTSLKIMPKYTYHS